MTMVATTAMTGPKPRPRLKAIPLLNARLNCRVQMTWMMCPSASAFTAQCFVS